MKIDEFYKNERFYNGFCAFQKNLNIFTVWVSIIVVCLSFVNTFAPNVTDVIMAVFHSLDFFKGSEDEGAAGLGNFVKSIYYGY